VIRVRHVKGLELIKFHQIHKAQVIIIIIIIINRCEYGAVLSVVAGQMLTTSSIWDTQACPL